MNPEEPGNGKPSAPGDLPTHDGLTSDGTPPQAGLRGRALEIDKPFGPYRLIRRLGRGGFAEVWEVEGVTTKRRLALKVLTQTRSPSPDLLERFKREGRLAASLNHPRCVFVFAAEEIDGYPVISMELMAGGTLQDRLDRRGPAPVREAVDTILDVIEGLEASHRAGILHRDIKPSNCFVDETGRCKIGDFGISKSLEAPADLTVTGGFVGTPSYASPEQVRGRDLDLRTDVYGVGATLYALVTGRPPFQGVQAGEVLARIVAEQPPPFSSYPVHVPNGLGRTILRAMSKEKEKRFGNYSELRAALLPFSSSGLTAGSMIKRFIAYEIDWLLFLPVVFALSRIPDPVRLAVFMSAVMFLYFTFTEKLWGRSLGKYLMNLCVTTASRDPLTYRQAFLRTFVLLSFQAPAIAITLLPFGQFTSFLALLVQAAVLVTARSRNGYAGLHELLSGTRVMALKKRGTLAVPVLQVPASGPDELHPSQLHPARRGPYAVVGTMWRSDSEALLDGYDELLNRKIWIHEYAAPISRPMAALVAVRPGRLHWLQGSREGAMNWDAYEAPSGIGFCQWVSEKGRLSWAEMREILLDTATELNARIEQDHFDARVSASHLWIDSLGTAKLLSFTAPRGGGRTTGFGEFDAPAWASFIHELTYFGLTGHLRPSDHPDTAVPRVPMPEYARPLLDRISGASERYPSLPGVLQELQRTANRPAALTRIRRAGPAAVIMVPHLLPFVVLAFLLFFLPMFSARRPWLQDLVSAPEYRNTLRRMSEENVASSALGKNADAIRRVMAYSYTQAQLTREGQQVLSGFPPDLQRDLEAAARFYPQLSETEVAEARSMIPQTLFRSLTPASLLRIIPLLIVFLGVASGVLAILMAAILGTGPLFRAFKMSLQTRDGQKAGRFRCSIRAAATWSPFLIPYGILSAFGFDVRLFPTLAGAVPFSLLMISIALSGLIYNLIKPDRGIPDIIAGTYLVPR